MRVLAIDGGGIRGLIPALVLAELERRAGRQVFELFDLIAGTSTGGILACALCAPEALPAAELVALYEEEGPEIFDRSLFQRIRSAEGLLDEKYDDAALDRALERFLARQAPAETKPDLIVPAYDTAAPGPLLLQEHGRRERARRTTSRCRSWPAPRRRRRPTSSRSSRASARWWTAACSRPTRRCARFAEVLNAWLRARTSCWSRSGPASARTSGPFDEIKDWGLAEWARPILDVVFDGVSDAVDYQLQRVLDPEPLLAPADGAHPGERRPRRRHGGQPRQPAPPRRGPDPRAQRRPRRDRGGARLGFTA